MLLLYAGSGLYNTVLWLHADECVCMCVCARKCRQRGTPMVNLSYWCTFIQDVTNQQHMAAFPGLLLCFKVICMLYSSCASISLQYSGSAHSRDSAVEVWVRKERGGEGYLHCQQHPRTPSIFFLLSHSHLSPPLWPFPSPPWCLSKCLVIAVTQQPI